MKTDRPFAAALAVLAGCTVTPDDSPYASKLSAACDACLTGSADTGAHCGAELDSCDDAAECEEYVLCQLRFDCYRSPPGGSCERTAGCRAPDPVDAAAAFESCARTQCRASCGFEALD